MRTTPRTEVDAVRVSNRTLLRPGWYDARITEAVEKKAAKSGRDMIEMTIMMRDAEGEERTFRDWLLDTPLGAAKLLHAAKAVEALDKYEAGNISQDDFPGHEVKIKIGVEKKRGYPDRNIIEDYQAAASSVVALRPAG